MPLLWGHKETLPILSPEQGDTGLGRWLIQGLRKKCICGPHSDNKAWMTTLSAVMLYFIRGIRVYRTGSSSP